MSNLLKRILPKETTNKIVNSVKEAFLFRPYDPTDLVQTPPQFELGIDVEGIKGYRYPAPGSQAAPNIPTRLNDDRHYNITFYDRDGRNVSRQESATLNTSGGATALSYDQAKAGSPGFKNAAVARYDPSGLRSAMTATWKELDAALAVNATPDHLPRAVWEKDYDKLLEEWEKKGIPPRLGKRYPAKSTSPIKATW